jgi:rhodanese-related sulfurtransferase
MVVHNVSNEELMRLIQETPDLQLVDVRTPEEIEETGYIAGSLTLPVQEIQNWAGTLSLKHPIAFMCRGGVRSLYACDYMQNVMKMDTENVPLYNLEHGMSHWDGDVVFPSSEDI